MSKKCEKYTSMTSLVRQRRTQPCPQGCIHQHISQLHWGSPPPYINITPNWSGHFVILYADVLPNCTGNIVSWTLGSYGHRMAT